MDEIPEEIRKMFPDSPIHKLDIVGGELKVIASAKPLSVDRIALLEGVIHDLLKIIDDHGNKEMQAHASAILVARNALVSNRELSQEEKDHAQTIDYAFVESQYIEQIEKELADLREQTRWIPVEERLPEDNQVVLAKCKPYQGSETVIVRVCDYIKMDAFSGFYNTDLDEWENAISWRPIDLPIKELR